MNNKFDTFIKEKMETLSEARKEGIEYKALKKGGKKPAETKEDTDAILAELQAHESGKVTTWAKQLLETKELADKAKIAITEMQQKFIDIDDEFFNVEDHAHSRILKTAQYILKFAKCEKKADEKGLKKDAAIQAGLNEIAALIEKMAPALKDEVSKIIDSLYEVKESSAVRKIPTISLNEASLADKAVVLFKKAFANASKMVKEKTKGLLSSFMTFIRGYDSNLKKLDTALEKVDTKIDNAKFIPSEDRKEEPKKEEAKKEESTDKTKEVAPEKETEKKPEAEEPAKEEDKKEEEKKETVTEEEEQLENTQQLARAYGVRLDKFDLQELGSSCTRDQFKRYFNIPADADEDYIKDEKYTIPFMPEKDRKLMVKMPAISNAAKIAGYKELTDIPQKIYAALDFAFEEGFTHGKIDR